MFYKSHSISKMLSQQNIPEILESAMKDSSYTLPAIMIRFKNLNVQNTGVIMGDDGRFSYRLSLKELINSEQTSNV